MTTDLGGRIARARERMNELDIEVLLLSVGADLPYLTGYEAMPLERLTMLVLPAIGDAHLVVPRLEAPRVTPQPDLFDIVPWEETDDPIRLVAKLVGPATRSAAIGDNTWARFVLDLQRARPHTSFTRATRIMAPIRMVKDESEVAALRAAAEAVDQIAVELRTRPFVGRSELDIHRELVERMLELGHERSNFAIVAAGEHAASPHHEPTADRVVAAGDIVLCDFGGTMHGYCSDITRMFHAGEPPSEVRDAYAVLVEAQEAGVRAATVGTPCAEVDAAARRVIGAAGLGEYFVHRVGHGIGQEAHEDPYMVSGNALPLVSGHAFSVEPGIYFEGRFGMRLEDIVVATDDGPLRLNEAPPDWTSRWSVDRSPQRMKLDGATFLLQWATGGLAFCWVTTRRREVSLGYGWLLRGVYGVMAAFAAALFATQELTVARSIALAGSIGVVLAAIVALTVSVVRRRAGVRGREAARADRRAAVAAMVGNTAALEMPDRERLREFPPALDLVAPIVGALSLLAAAQFAGGPYALAAARLLVGAAFLGSVTDAMLLGHWYLVQPGLQRDALKELVRIAGYIWPIEVFVFLWPVGMVQVLNGTISDGYDGILGWIWIACAVTTIGLVVLTWYALKERYYSAVMAATGLLYLAILTAFGTDLVARAVLKP